MVGITFQFSRAVPAVGVPAPHPSEITDYGPFLAVVPMTASRHDNLVLKNVCPAGPF